MRRSLRPTLIKFGIFGVVMALLTASLFFIFGQYQTGSTKDYSAVFADASRLKTGQSVRVAGMRVGTVNSVKLRQDKTVLVTFDADPSVRLTTGTRAAVRYLNLVGDRYLELIDGPGDTVLPPGSQIPNQALFEDAGGLAVGNDVTISGTKVGSVSNVGLQGRNAIVTFSLDGTVSLGSDTTAHVRTGTLLGERVLTLESKGNGTMHPNDIIPVTRTASPYSLTEAVSELTTNTAGTDTGTLNQSLDTLSATLDQLAPQLGPTFDGITRLSQAINERDDTLGDLLKDGADVTKILSDRSEQVNTLILNANDLVAVLSERRRAIVELLVHTSALSKQLSGVIHDNEERLAPTLDKLNAVTAVLENNRDNIGKALPGLAKFQTTLGETIGNGPYYQAYVPNLDIAQILQPFLDYAFGFRRGSNAGQPPDNAGPRAELPFPYNGIPGPGEQWGPPG